MPDQVSLSKNAIKSFILRVDLVKSDNIVISKIAEEMSKHFDRTEKRQISNFSINFTKGESEVAKRESFDYVLISEAKSFSMVFSEPQNAFWIESSAYKDNTIYKDTINKTIEVLSSHCGDVISRRIGLRFINEFKCEKRKDIPTVFGKRLSSALKAMINEKSQSRIIGMEETNNNGYKMRLQYGIPNKFYPSIITIYDLLLDIDSYSDNGNPIGDWVGVISSLNHAAYGVFFEEINPKYIETLR